MSHKQNQLLVIDGQHRAAFTLVELLIVIMIISILAALTLVASNAAVRAAKEAKTRATIVKLDTALRQIYERYEERFDNIFGGLDTAQKELAEALPESQKVAVKLHLIHDLMRMELPQCQADVTNGPQSDGNFALTGKPTVSEYYSSGASNAELLFLIIQNLSPETLEAFQGSEVGDFDNNGRYEFLDAWGNPIRFIRFAPALPISDLQPDLWKIANNAPTESNWNGLTQDNFNTARLYYPDPLDPNQLAPKSWFLYPVIFSAGADGKYDLQINDTPTDAQTTTPFDVPNGIPVDEDGDGLNHYDNITNHHLSGY